MSGAYKKNNKSIFVIIVVIMMALVYGKYSGTIFKKNEPINVGEGANQVITPIGLDLNQVQKLLKKGSNMTEGEKSVAEAYYIKDRTFVIKFEDSDFTDMIITGEEDEKKKIKTIAVVGINKSTNLYFQSEFVMGAKVLLSTAYPERTWKELDEKLIEIGVLDGYGYLNKVSAVKKIDGIEYNYVYDSKNRVLLSLTRAQMLK